MEAIKGFKAVLKRTLNNSELYSQPTGSPSASTPSTSTPSESTKERDILAFRTITTMLKFIQSPKGGQEELNEIIGKSEDDLATLKILDALSAVLIREHEITAVMAKAYDGEIPIFASVVDQTAKPSLQSDANSDGFWSRMRDFTVSMNPRTTQVNNNTDSLMNATPLPIIGDYEDSVPTDLVQASSQGNVSLLGVYLKSHW